MLGLLGNKRGMTQVFDAQGNLVSVTILEVGPCTVVQKKGKEKEGYLALQLGFGDIPAKRRSKAYRGHCEKKKVPVFRRLKEFRVENASDFNEGDVFSVDCFQPEDLVDITGCTKGHGFQGVIKRHGKAGGPAAHGASRFHRGTGSIGMRTWPGRVIKGMRLPGRMGSDRVTVKNLRIVKILKEENLLLVEGSVPGTRNGDIFVVQRERVFKCRSVEV